MKTALVLSGGGAKGSVQFGILKYLYEKGLRPDVIYGTSVGSLNAAGLSFIGIDGLEKVWSSIQKMSDVFKFNWKVLIGKASGIYNGAPLRKIIQDVVSNNEPHILAYSCAVSLYSGEIGYFSCHDEHYVAATLASSSVPVLTEDVNGWVDGGVREQTPLKKAIEDGADKIVVVLCNPIEKNPNYDFVKNIIKTLLRTTDILGHEIFLNDIQNCIWYNENSITGKRKIELEVYAPQRLVISTHDFTQDKIQPAIKYGYEVAKNGPIDIEYIKLL